MKNEAKFNFCINREEKREEMLPAAIQLLNSELAEFDVTKVGSM